MEIELTQVDTLFAKYIGGEGSYFLANLLASARSGHLYYSPDKEMEIPVSLIGEGQPIAQYGNRYYLQRHLRAETEVVEALAHLTKAKPRLPLSLRPEGVTKEQEMAILQMSQHSLTLLTGGPGTGKTYTAAHLIKEILRVDPHHRIALAAPTGKAVGNLEEALASALGSAKLEVKTLHSLLRQGQILPFDFILIDEASMIDVEMMAILLKAVRPGARLVLMGDADQLPPIEAGSLYADMVACKGMQVAKLMQCLRVESKELVELASLINQGIGADHIPCHPLTKEELIDRIAPLFPSNEELAPIKQFGMLAPLRKGPFGIDGINTLFHSYLKKKHQGKIAVPIMITKNAHPLSLFNGEIGLLTSDGNHALFPARGKDAPFYDKARFLRKVPRQALPPFELAYCLSVHKSQGSEFNHVAFALSPGGEVFSRELFYTALTRARSKFDFYGSQESLHEMIARKGIRRSSLQERLLGRPIRSTC